MENDILVSFDRLAKLLNTTADMLRIFTSHFTLYKYVSHEFLYKPKKTKVLHFTLNNKSINALQHYLDLRQWRRDWDLDDVKKYYNKQLKSIIKEGGESAKLN